MKAIIKLSGRQYQVVPDGRLRVGRIALEKGAELVVDQVLMVEDGNRIEVGSPTVPYRVTLEVLDQTRGPKGLSYTFFRRGGRRVKRGWRERYSVVRVKSIAREGA